MDSSKYQEDEGEDGWETMEKLKFKDEKKRVMKQLKKKLNYTKDRSEQKCSNKNKKEQQNTEQKEAECVYCKELKPVSTMDKHLKLCKIEYI